MKEDYKKAVYYRKLSQKSTKPWRKNLSKSPSNERLPPINQSKSQSPKSTSKVANQQDQETKKNAQAANNGQEANNQQTENDGIKKKGGRGKKGEKNGEDRYEKGAFHSALCDDFLEDEDLN